MGVNRISGLGLAALVFGLDQGIKLWLLQSYGLSARPAFEITPFLDLVLAWNRGISYSLLRADSDLARWGLVAFSLAIVGGLIVWLWRGASRVTSLALGFIIGGALGNALDRALYGAVADYLYFHTTWPVGPLANYVFNLADAAIIAGVGLLLYETIWTSDAATGPGSGAQASDATKLPR